MNHLSSIGLIGLAVMGKNLARNIAQKKYKVSVYNRTTAVTDEFIEQHGGAYIIGEKTIESFVASLATPRKIILMVKAGDAVDAVIEELTPHLEAGDTIIDCGNTFYRDTQRRYAMLKEKNIHFIGSGISGGEEGALHGPSLMPGGPKDAWKGIEPIWKKIAAKDFAGKPCVSYMGEDGAGHFVKMVHNGIEYGVMQLIAEAYDCLKTMHSLTPPEIQRIFKHLNNGPLKSYLFDITIDILEKKDDLTKGYLIDSILDTAQQKGTGKWTSVESLDRGIALPTITEGVFARCTSAEKKLRITLSTLYREKKTFKTISKKSFLPILEQAFSAAIISCYAQGFHLIERTAREEGWRINLAEVARIWQGGCIIRAKLLTTIHAAYQQKNNQSLHLLSIPSIARLVKQHRKGLREFVSLTVRTGIPIPAFAASLNYIEAMTQARSSANMIQALRDYFGAHTYERTDRAGVFHTEWNSSEK